MLPWNPSRQIYRPHGWKTWVNLDNNRVASVHNRAVWLCAGSPLGGRFLPMAAHTEQVKVRPTGRPAVLDWYNMIDVKVSGRLRKSFATISALPILIIVHFGSHVLAHGLAFDSGGRAI